MDDRQFQQELQALKNRVAALFTNLAAVGRDGIGSTEPIDGSKSPLLTPIRLSPPSRCEDQVKDNLYPMGVAHLAERTALATLAAERAGGSNSPTSPPPRREDPDSLSQRLNDERNWFNDSPTTFYAKYAAERAARIDPSLLNFPPPPPPPSLLQGREDPDPFSQRFIDHQTHLNAMRAGITAKHPNGQPADRVQQAGLSQNVGVPPQAHNRLVLPTGPLFWELYTGLRTDVQGLDQRVSAVERGLSDLEDRVDRMDPTCHTPASSAVSSNETPTFTSTFTPPKELQTSFSPRLAVSELSGDMEKTTNATDEAPDCKFGRSDSQAKGKDPVGYSWKFPYGSDEPSDRGCTHFTPSQVRNGYAFGKFGESFRNNSPRLGVTQVDDRKNDETRPQSLDFILDHGDDDASMDRIAFRKRSEIARNNELIARQNQILAHNSEQLRMMSERLRPREGTFAWESTSPKEMRHIHLDRASREYVEKAVLETRRLQGLCAKKDQQIEKLEGAEKQLSEDLNEWSRSWYDLKQESRDNLRHWQEEKDKEIKMMRAYHDDRMSDLEGFCEHKASVIQEQEQIIVRGCQLLGERDGELAQLQCLLRVAENDKEQLIHQNASNLALLAETRAELDLLKSKRESVSSPELTQSYDEDDDKPSWGQNLHYDSSAAEAEAEPSMSLFANPGSNKQSDLADMRWRPSDNSNISRRVREERKAQKKYYVDRGSKRSMRWEGLGSENRNGIKMRGGRQERARREARMQNENARFEWRRPNRRVPTVSLFGDTEEENERTGKHKQVHDEQKSDNDVEKEGFSRPRLLVRLPVGEKTWKKSWKAAHVPLHSEHDDEESDNMSTLANAGYRPLSPVLLPKRRLHAYVETETEEENGGTLQE